MNAYRDADDEDDWEDDPVGSDSGDDLEDPDHEPTVPCPYCRREILEDSPRCPYCERFISAEDRLPAGKPVWIIVTALVCLGVAIWWAIAVF
jgi:hypothetical protein